jgi:aminomuconate-semialdehyde/2-hydroxymuconate-6-semialdehyde dehydrogenase
MQQIKNYIGGKFQSGLSQKFIDNFEPATGKVFSILPDSDAQDVAQAVQAAQQAFEPWRDLGVEGRSQYLLSIAQTIEDRASEFALAESQDSGKPLTLARQMDIARSVSNFRFFATAILHQSNESYQNQGFINYTNRQPLGVVGCISPWNLPLYLLSWKIAPALAAGCSVVAKPSEFTPLTAFLLSEVCEQVGLPKGVLNIVQGLGPKVGQAIVEHSDVEAISFTGGTATGSKIASIAAPKFKKLSLELGGKNATIVFADADLDQAAATAARAAFTNQGQICLCGSRILIEKTVYQAFKEKFLEAARQYVPADPLEASTRMGALVSQQHLNKVLNHLQIADQEGATLLLGGQKAELQGRCKDGYFLNPTVLEGLSPFCRTNQEEIFGPVATLAPFEDEAQALSWANSTPYGLAASLWTNHLPRAHRFAQSLKTGIVWINCWLVRDLRTPFGGMKQSGVGREGGFHALEFFCEEQNICIKF